MIDSKLISEIPLGDGTAYGLTRLVPGASFERSYALQRPMDNDNLRGMTITGTINSEFTIDGSSNVVSQARVGIQPPSDAIEEFKVETAAYDAQIGHTGAGAVNLALKSGTNQFHGSASYYNRDDSRSANLFASNGSGSGKTPRDYNRFSGAIGGPIFRNKTFFMFSYEKLQDDTIEAFTSSVPTARMRDGDFSELLSQRRADLRSAHRAPGQRRRRPRSVPGQHHPGRPDQPDRAQRARVLSRAATRRPRRTSRRTSSPSSPGRTATTSRWCASTTSGRRNQRTYGRFIRNFRREERYNFAGELNGVEITRGATDRFNFNYAVGHTAVLSPTTVLDLKGSWLRFNDDLFPLYTIDPASLGFSSSTAGALRRLPATAALQPRIGVGHHSGTRRDARRPAERLQQRTHAAVLQRPVRADADQDCGLAHVQGRLRLAAAAAGRDQSGLESRRLRVRRQPTRARPAPPRASMARASPRSCSAFPSTNSIFETRSNYDARVNSHGAFVHDDWRVSDRLTLNLGLRYDLELGLTEVENRNIGGFDLTTTNPIEAQARANFAANPPAGVPIAARRSTFVAATPICRAISRRRGTRTRTTSSRARASPTS